MTTRVSVDFRDGAVVSAADRGFTYGDGLFETLRVVDGAIPLWTRHVDRLTDGCARLRMPPPDASALRAEILRLCSGWSDVVVRATVSRGVGERGYALPAPQRPTVVVSAAPLALDPVAAHEGIAIRLCDMRLAAQPALAGLKHLNRLEQVLARAEWSDPGIGEGLMRDAEGRVVCATAANLFAVVDGRVHTPPVDQGGVAGVARAEILATQAVAVAPLSLDQLLGATEVFLTSAVRGILPVRALGARTWQPGPVARALQAHWASLGLPLPSRSKDRDR
jgi:aminodeoxychorismate lyase